MHQLIITTGKTKGFDTLLESLNDPEHILLLEKAYIDLFSPDDQTLGDVLEGDGITQDWLDELGDHGVTEFKSYREPDILRLLGLPPDGPPYFFPFCNRVIHDQGDILSLTEAGRELLKVQDEAVLKQHKAGLLTPRWHQLVGLAACVKRFFRQLNVILADGVGVGKTMQYLMIMAYLRHLNVTNASPPPIGKLTFHRRQRLI